MVVYRHFGPIMVSEKIVLGHCKPIRLLREDRFRLFWTKHSVLYIMAIDNSGIQYARKVF